MLIQNTEPGTFLRLSLYNTRLLTRKNSFSTLRGGGLLLEVALAWAVSTGFHAPVIWFPAFLAGATGLLLGADFAIGVRNTMIELKVIDTMEDSRDNSSEAREQEGESRDEEGEGGATTGMAG